MIYVNSAQKTLAYMGYHAMECSRATARRIELITRPMPEADLVEVIKRIWYAVSALILAVCAIVLAVPGLACYILASCVGQGRFEYIRPESVVSTELQQSIKIVSLNACFQDPFAPLTGGVVPPFDPVGDAPSRISAVVDAIAVENPEIFVGQEFDNLGAQDEFIRLMQEQGFHYFLRDLGSTLPFMNHSGLLVASKIELADLNILFTPYPDEDREGAAKWAGQGALAFSVPIEGGDLRIINVHLNYGAEETQGARNRQLKSHVVPLLQEMPAVVLGDLNFDTSTVDRNETGLEGFTNALERQVTCSDEGKHVLRGKGRNLDGLPCQDCEERIDGLIYDPNQVMVENVHVKPLRLGEQLLSDHYMTVATLGFA